MISSLNILYHRRSDLEDLRAKVGDIQPQKTLIQVFSGQVILSELQVLQADLKAVFPNVPLIGTTTAGEILDGQVQDRSVVVSITSFESAQVQVAWVDHYQDLSLAGKSLAAKLVETTPQAIIVFGCSIQGEHKVDVTPLLTELYSAFSNVIVAGGQAGDNGAGEMSYVFTADGIFSQGAVAASLSGEKLSVHNVYNLSWVPIGKRFTITHAEGARLYSIDDQSPRDLYEHYLGQDVVRGLPLSAADFPLVIERQGVPIAIHALGVYDDGSCHYVHELYPGEQVRFGFCHSSLLTEAATAMFEDIQSHPAQALFVYSCVTRKWILGEDIKVEISPLSKIAPTSGFFAYGEYFTHPVQQCYLFSQTMTVLSLSEGEVSTSPQASVALGREMMEPESRQLQSLRALHRLVETSANELEEVNLQLADLVNEDSLTGLYNRRYFDHLLEAECKRAQRSQQKLSLILLDVDYFKLYNDTYGHVQGDSCLRAVSQVLKAMPRRPSDCVARYGGEEFVCILPNTDYAGAMEVAHQLKTDINKLSIPHRASKVAPHLTVSIGIQTVEVVTAMTKPEQIIIACDQQLYRAKCNGRNQIIGASEI